MSRLSIEGRAALEAVKAAREQYKAEVAAIEAEVRDMKKQAKAPVRAAIEAARTMGVSQNRIALDGMGYTGPAPLKSFLQND